MPELPEVQTIVNGLNQKIPGKEIREIIELRPGTVIRRIQDQDLGIIVRISRRGKYIILQTSNQIKIVIHLRMTGKLIFEPVAEKLSKYARAEIVFTDQTRLIFNDIRTFGKIIIAKEEDGIFPELGAEPLSDSFNTEYLKEKLSKRKAPVKNLLLDQQIIAGLGNIYASEILFRCRIDPRKAGNKLKMAQIRSIVEQTKTVLREAIEHNGTTISDYRSVEDKTGEFQNFLNVYGQKNCPCGAGISRIKQAGRSTFFCARCQK